MQYAWNYETKFLIYRFKKANTDIIVWEKEEKNYCELPLPHACIRLTA